MTKTFRPWETLSRKNILDAGKFLKVESHTIKLPDGRIIDDWAWVISPDAVIVLARNELGEFLVFRQTKYAVKGTSLAPVGGMLEQNEEPLLAAKRELLEETGYESHEWISLGNYINEPNRGVNISHLFLALDAFKVAEPDCDDLEDQELLFFSHDELLRALLNGEFKVITWSAVVAMSLNYLNFTNKVSK